MIRSLLGSSILASSLLLTQPISAATTAPTPMLATPQLKINGKMSVNSLFFNNKRIFKAGDSKDADCKRRKYGRGQLFTVDKANLKFAIEGRTDPGMEYGLVFVLDGNAEADKHLREAYLFFGGSWGRVYFGDTYGVQNTMAFGGFDEWGGTGFIDGGVLDRVVNYTTGTYHSVDLAGDTGRDTKLSYFSPRFYNVLQIGVSYTPRGEHRAEGKIEARRSTKTPKVPWDSDSVATGINFIHKFENGFEMGLSATSIFAETHSQLRHAPPRKNTASYAFGGDFNYKAFGFGVEYGNNNHSQEYKHNATLVGSQNSSAGQFLDFGLSYSWSPATKLSTGYYYAWRNALAGTGTLTNPFVKKKAKTKAVMAAIDHKLAPGLGVYLEYAYLQMKNPAAKDEAARLNKTLDKCGEFDGPVKSNVANVFIVGSRLVF